MVAWSIVNWEIPIFKGKEEEDGGKTVIKWSQ